MNVTNSIYQMNNSIMLIIIRNLIRWYQIRLVVVIEWPINLLDLCTFVIYQSWLWSCTESLLHKHIRNCWTQMTTQHKMSTNKWWRTIQNIMNNRIQNNIFMSGELEVQKWSSCSFLFQSYELKKSIWLKRPNKLKYYKLNLANQNDSVISIQLVVHIDWHPNCCGRQNDCREILKQCLNLVDQEIVAEHKDEQHSVDF